MAGEPTKELVGEADPRPGGRRAAATTAASSSSTSATAGITQLVINPELAPEAAELAHQIRNEFVLRAEGTLVARSAETVNLNMPTGEVELQVETLRSSAARRRCRSSSTRRTSTRRCASATAGSTCAARSCSATSPCARRWSGSSAGRWRPRLPRHPDADPQADARARDFVVPPPAEGPLLRAPAEPADPQAADDGRRLRPLLPDRDLLPGRGSPRRPRPGDHAARRRDELPDQEFLYGDGAMYAGSGASASGSRSRRPSRG